MIPYGELNVRAAGILMEWLREEITRTLGERRPLEEKWLRYQRLYKAVPEVQLKEFPFLGAANLVLPVIATDVDTIFSRFMGILFQPDSLWACRALREDAVDYAPKLQEFLRWAQNNELEAYNACVGFLLEKCKLGTGVLKERYRRESRLAYEFREMPGGTLAQHRRVLLKDSPVIQHVQLINFLVASGTQDHQQCAFNAERLLLTWGQLQDRIRNGIYTADGGARLMQWHARERGSFYQQEMHRMQGFGPGLGDRFELWEVWTDFDIRGAGEPVSVVCTLHLPTMTYLRVDYNPFFHQERPYSVARYMPQEGQFYGIGLGEMLESFQDEATAMHNQRLDNNTISNASMMKFKKGIGIRSDEPIFPGRWFPVDEMDDIQPLQMGAGRFNTTVQDEQLTMSYATRRTGVNDYVMGSAEPNIGYAALGTNILQHREAAKRFDQGLRESRQALGASGRRVVELYQQFNQGGKVFSVLGQRDGDVLTKLLQFPLELIRHSVSVEVTATSASMNKDVEIRTQTIVMQMVTQFYTQLFQGISIVVNPQVPMPLRMLAYRMVVGAVTLMRRTLDSYEVQDAESIIPRIEEIIGAGGPLAGLGGVQEQLAGSATVGPGVGPAPGLLQAPGMGAPASWPG